MEAGIGSGTHREVSLKIDNKKRQLLAMRSWRNKNTMIMLIYMD